MQVMLTFHPCGDHQERIAKFRNRNTRKNNQPQNYRCDPYLVVILMLVLNAQQNPWSINYDPFYEENAPPNADDSSSKNIAQSASILDEPTIKDESDKRTATDKA